MNRPIQEVFDAVINAGVYYPTSTGRAECGAYRSEFMCNALNNASGSFGAELITDAEYAAAIAEINAYIETYGPVVEHTLGCALRGRGLPHDFEARLAIYKDWANRPSLGSM